VLSAGYGEGLPRKFVQQGKVLIKGKKAPITGRVCMNMTMVDVTGLRMSGPGTRRFFLGLRKERNHRG